MATTVYENTRVQVMVLFDSSIKVIIRRGGEFDTDPNQTVRENVHAVNEYLFERARSYNQTAVYCERRGNKGLAAAARAAANSCVQAADHWSDALHRALNRHGVRLNHHEGCRFIDEYETREAMTAWKVLSGLN